ncbi:MAG: cytochrome C [Deltaproteobacteria bacterium]|nr:MAG: cytochrome C [Deltaproteobacteria bacterium]
MGILRPSNKVKEWIEGILFFFAGLIGALIIGWLIFPIALYSEHTQPIDFNHAIHLENVEGDSLSEKCLYCHEFYDDGNFAGIPRLEKCTDCHDPESPLGDSLQEKKFIEDYLAKEKEIPWYQYYKQPDCVYFPHVTHVKRARLECKVCHGNHGTSEYLPVYQQNRISGYSRNIWGKHISGYKKHTWDRMKMDDCAECHTKKGHEEYNSCFTCHK